MSAGYLYDSAERLHTRKPYSFAPIADHDHLSEWAVARGRVNDKLTVAAAEVQPYVPSARFRLDDADPLRVSEALGDFFERWNGEQAADTIGLAAFLDDLVETLRPAPAALLVQSSASRWTSTTLQTLLERFEGYGCIHAEYDRDWRRTHSNPNPPEAVIRLALSGAWLAWVTTALQRTRALAALNATLKLNDLASSGVRHHGWSLDPQDRARLAAAIRIEAKLLESWQSFRSGERWT